MDAGMAAIFFGAFCTIKNESAAFVNWRANENLHPNHIHYGIRLLFDA